MINGKIMLNIYIYIFCLSEEIHYFHLASLKIKGLPRKAFHEGKWTSTWEDEIDQTSFLRVQLILLSKAVNMGKTVRIK